MQPILNRFVIAALAALLGHPAAGQPLGCLIEPSQIAEIGTPVTGVVAAMHVDRGDRVRAGQIIAVLRADVERAAVSVAERRAQADAEQQAAAVNLEFARSRLVRSKDLLAKDFISAQALEQVRTETSVAEQKLAQIKEQRRIWEEELSLARAQLSQRTIASPIDGVVADRYASPGERVEDKPLVRVAAIHPLRVEVIVPASHFGLVAEGTTARVTPELPDAASRPAKVNRVDKVVDAASNTFRVRLELANADHALPSGLRCIADLGLPVAEPKARAANAARSGLERSVPHRVPASPALDRATRTSSVVQR